MRFSRGVIIHVILGKKFQMTGGGYSLLIVESLLHAERSNYSTMASFHSVILRVKFHT
jgi:hypothetical protein